MQEDVSRKELMGESFVYPSMFGDAEVSVVELADGTLLRVLFVDGGFQSASYIGARRFEPPFKYCLAFDQLFSVKPDARRILLIGGGAFSYPKHVLTERGNVCMDVVEIDPVVIDIARGHFYLDELETMYGDRLKVFACDGIDYLESYSVHKESDIREDSGAHGESGIRDKCSYPYDAIIDDSFAGATRDAVLLGGKGLEMVKRCLVPDGVYMVNGYAQTRDDPYGYEAVEALDRALSSHFAHVQRKRIVDHGFGDSINTVCMASDSDFGLNGFMY